MKRNKGRKSIPFLCFEFVVSFSISSRQKHGDCKSKINNNYKGRKKKKEQVNKKHAKKAFGSYICGPKAPGDERSNGGCFMKSL
jgi:hypothetical protein